MRVCAPSVALLVRWNNMQAIFITALYFILVLVVVGLDL